MDAEAVVAEFVDGGWTGLEALEACLSGLGGLIVRGQYFGPGASGGFFLSVNEVDGEAFGVVESDHMAAARGGGVHCG